MAIAPQAAASLRVGPVGLAVSEQLVLASLRAWARARMCGEDPRELVRPGLTHVSSKPVASVFVALMEHVERNALRSMEVHCVACGGYSRDEQRVVLACGVARCAPDVALQLLRPLVAQPEAPVLLARTLNVALCNAGFPMPVRMWDDDASVPATVH